jgi:hypothetical protein
LLVSYPDRKKTFYRRYAFFFPFLLSNLRHNIKQRCPFFCSLRYIFFLFLFFYVFSEPVCS